MQFRLPTGTTSQSLLGVLYEATNGVITVPDAAAPHAAASGLVAVTEDDPRLIDLEPPAEAPADAAAPPLPDASPPADTPDTKAKGSP